MSLTLNDIKEQLGESLHTALRKCNYSEASDKLHRAISVHSASWCRYLHEVKMILDSYHRNGVKEINFNILKIAYDNFVYGDRGDDTTLINAFRVLSDDDFEGMASYLVSDVNGMGVNAEPSLVGCDTIQKAVAYAKTLPTVEEALSWISVWEHERALKSDSLETFFDFAMKEVVENFKEVKIAFWGHDKFPFLLHSPIESVQDFPETGCVKLTKYGKMVVKPTYVLPQEVGEEFAEKLDHLSSHKSRAIDELNKLYKDELNNINKRYSGYKT